MKRYVLGGSILILVVLTMLMIFWFGGTDKGRGGNSGGRRILYYVDPMNPAHTSDKPGIAPCGMKMEPVYGEDGPDGQIMGSGSAPSMPAGTVKVSPEKQQLIGIKTAVVEKTAVNHVIRTVGRVVADETRVYRLNASVDGWIRETYDNGTGSLVKKSEKLASFYSPEFLAAEQAYIYALTSLDRFQASEKGPPSQVEHTKVNIKQYVDSLRNLGMSEGQIKELARNREYSENIFIVTPATGFIVARNVSLGQRFEKGTEWYRIADLSRVWILADLFRNEAGNVRPGTKVKVTLSNDSKAFVATVGKALPQFDSVSRTLKVRLEMENPGWQLRPDMFVDVEFPLRLSPTLTVPVDAIIDSGLRKTIFVDLGNGYFEPRQVEAGARIGDRVEIRKGLSEGEKIVVSGNFLIDSESRMKAAISGMHGKTGP